MLLLFLIFLFILFGGLRHKPIELNYTIYMQRPFNAANIMHIYAAS